MVEFIVHKDKEEKKKAGQKKSNNAGPSFWLPFAVVLAGALIAGAVLFKDLPAGRQGQLVGRPGGTAALPEDVNVLGETAAPQGGGQATPTGGQAAPTDLKVNLENVPMLGEATASVTIVEFSDFQCPYCEQFFTLTLPQVKKEYVETGKVKYYFKNFPLVTLHKNAAKAAEAALCAEDQGKFWVYHDQLFAKQGEWAEQTSPSALFKKYAGGLALGAAAFAQCLDSGNYAAEVMSNLNEGQTLGVTGTPSFVINGKLFVGAYPFAEIKRILDELLK